MKCHAGVDAGSGLVHTISVTAANVHDINVAADLIREDDGVFYGDWGYLGIEKRDRGYCALLRGNKGTGSLKHFKRQSYLTFEIF